MLLGGTLVIRMVGSISLQEKQSEGWVSRLRQLRDGGENDQDAIMKTPASKKMKHQHQLE